ncbi:alpha-1-macroglobulin-like [Penaeus chinensis]|uniref:alpha-1-macroglobulin-like n=1 Tax=Penaeus chinensis TaxID=139456 RepID=UPI001FB6CAA2|nr:alpha-1-macroglobulin-like [Penaeus chinensis]
MEMPGVSSLMLESLALLCFAFSTCSGAYLITTPRQWTPGEENQICVNVPDVAAAAGFISLRMETTEYDRLGRRNVTLLPETTFEVPAGRVEACQQVIAPRRAYPNVALHLSGSVGGADLKETRDIRLKGGYNLTLIETDKYLYEPGQEVKFRVLTIHGSKGQVVTDPYPEIWVTTQSKTRVAQWMNVDNSAGLVHLSFHLADELEQGYYSITVKDSGRMTTRKVFKVEEYVLPRFEVKVTPPDFLLASDEQFAVEVSAMYAFGRPVKGSVTLEISNDMSRKCRVVIKKTGEIKGHRQFAVAASELRLLECEVRALSLRAAVEEEGTGVSLGGGSVSVLVSRSAIHLTPVSRDNYKKPNLPFIVKVRASLPDMSPAPGVPIEVCGGGRCTNMTTADDGILTAVVSGSANRIFMSTLNCRAGMRATSYSSQFRYYYSPSNSSLLIQVPEGRLKCTPGGSGSYDLPVFFSANNQSAADLTVQVMSRGKVQKWMIHPVEFLHTPLPIDPDWLVDEPAGVDAPFTTGVVSVPLALPPSAAPSVQVLVWYTRDDGEVVSDRAELEVEKCLGYSANLTWSAAQGQPGEATTLTVTAEPGAVCSVGIVDKSSERSNPEPDPFSLDAIFAYLDGFKISPWVNSQVNDFRYCEKKMRAKMAPGASEADGMFPPSRSAYYYSDYVDALKMFDDSGLYVISDQVVETRPCEEDSGSDFGWSFGRPAARGAGDQLEAGADAGARVRAPEAWLWELLAVPPTGIVRQLELPDRMTEWVGKAVCAHPEKGVGLSERASITTFTPFFSDLTLPPSIKRGEVLPVKISVFNYLDQSLPIRVILEESPEYEVIEGELESARGGSGKRRQTLEYSVVLREATDQETTYKIVNLTEIKDPRTNSNERSASEEPRRLWDQRWRRDRKDRNRRGPRDDRNSSTGRNQRTACLGPKERAVLSFLIRPLAFGDVSLSVSAFVDYSIPGRCGGGGEERVERRDTLVKTINVEAEGFAKEETRTKYACAEELAEGKDSLEAWQVAPPEKIVADSARSWVSVEGDLLALTLENLGSLIRTPHGSGEQNMVNFAPSIYIMQYLEATKQGTPESTRKLLRFMRMGYQRELVHRRRDGSFSPFGVRDDSGSTWLTAFVLKTFAQAKQFITIDEGVLKDMRRWLVKTRLDKGGCMESVGQVFLKKLEGGLSSDKPSREPLTAYVLIALLESGMDADNETLSDLVHCLVSASKRTKGDPYALSLKAYALALAKDPGAEEVLQRLTRMAAVDETAIYWKAGENSSSHSPRAVATAAYALLAMLALDPRKYAGEARRVVRGAARERNGQGGFYSTQDTVVALQALSLYETIFYKGSPHAKATVTAQDFSHAFEVTEGNKLLQQFEALPVLPTGVSFTVEGRGCVLIQTVLRYNIPEAEASDAFSLRINATNDENDKKCALKHLEVCSTYLLPDGASNTAVIEINLVSGFVPPREGLEAVVRENSKVIKRYDFEGNKVTLYVDKFVTGKELCVDFDVVRDVQVEDSKPGTVLVYDFYEPAVTVGKNFEFLPAEGC